MPRLRLICRLTLKLITVLATVFAMFAAASRQAPGVSLGPPLPAGAAACRDRQYQVGAYYFPGWPTLDKWKVLDPFPERMPLLGYYREGDPAVMDWQIKWAVEHGVSFFAFDWYWDRGRRQLEHALHDGYLHARFRRFLKFCLLWANHNPPGRRRRPTCWPWSTTGSPIISGGPNTW